MKSLLVVMLFTFSSFGLTVNNIPIYPNAYSNNIQDPNLMKLYWTSLFQNLHSPNHQTSLAEKLPIVHYNEPTLYEETLINEGLGNELIHEYIKTNEFLDYKHYTAQEGEEVCKTSPVDNIVNDEALKLSQNIMDVVAYLEKDRMEKNGVSTRAEVFKLADAIIEKQLDLFDIANNLEGTVSKEDNFLIRTVKDPELDEASFKRRAQLISATIDLMTEKFEETGRYTNFPSTLSIHKKLTELGLSPQPGEASYISYVLINISSKMQQDWKFFQQIPPKGSTSSDKTKIDKLKSIQNITAKVLDDSSKISAEDFNYYAYFISSPKQITTIFVQPNKGDVYLPFKETRPIQGPSLSSTIGTKLFQGDMKQPEGFLNASWGGASASVTNSDYNAAMYYRAHVDYGRDDSATERRKLREKLKKTGLNGSKGGDIRIHADVGSIGCLELPIEDSVAITGMTRNGKNMKMQTIPFKFTEENIRYFSQKIEGYGEFWNSIYKKEKDEYQFGSAIPISTLINEASKGYN